MGWTTENKQPDERAASVADALAACDWADAPIGNKAIIQSAIEILRTTQQADKGDERIERLRKSLFESRDAMRVMGNWVKKSDPAAYSWAMEMVSRANDVLSHAPDARAAVTLSNEQIVQAWKSACTRNDVGDNHECAIAMVRALLAVHPVEEHIRYCPECGHLGDVKEGTINCCPDGNRARVIPKQLAEISAKTFKLAIGGGTFQAFNHPASQYGR